MPRRSKHDLSSSIPGELEAPGEIYGSKGGERAHCRTQGGERTSGGEASDSTHQGSARRGGSAADSCGHSERPSAWSILNPSLDKSFLQARAFILFVPERALQYSALFHTALSRVQGVSGVHFVQRRNHIRAIMSASSLFSSASSTASAATRVAEFRSLAARVPSLPAVHSRQSARRSAAAVSAASRHRSSVAAAVVALAAIQGMEGSRTSMLSFRHACRMRLSSLQSYQWYPCGIDNPITIY